MNIELVKTCEACPEQYDVLINGRQAAYLRLRNGLFYAECPDTGGEVVHESYPNGDGIFDHDERQYHIGQALAKVLSYHGMEDL